MKQIPLTQGKFALVDDADYEWLMQWNYFYCNGYAARKTSGRFGEPRKLIYMHREVMKAPDGTLVDHRNTERTLDNRRRNLRVCTRSQNGANTKKHANNHSGFKGVSLITDQRKPYRAEIRISGDKIYLGSFDKADEAARAYDAKAKELFGEFARTNF
jgi:hypothetical protein